MNKTEFAQALPSLGLTVTREQSELREKAAALRAKAAKGREGE